MGNGRKSFNDAYTSVLNKIPAFTKQKQRLRAVFVYIDGPEPCRMTAGEVGSRALSILRDLSAKYLVTRDLAGIFVVFPN
jgi:hypothetical protein